MPLQRAYFVLLAFEFAMGLFPAVLEETRSDGIDLTPKYIPTEVFLESTTALHTYD